jgi:endo-1,4-beta-xylanase
MASESMQTDVSGNEWMAVREVDRTHLANLRPRQDVLAEAREGIEKHRKSDVRVRFSSGDGSMPIAGALVRVEQVSHAFQFGCSSGFTLPQVRNDPVKRARAELFAGLFNCATAKCYWDEMWHQPIEQRQGERITQAFVDEIDWATANGIAVRGHPLVWTVPKAIPQWVRRYPYEKQLQFLEHNVRSLIACAGGRVKLWDVVNEPLWEASLRNLPKRQWPHIESTEEMLTYIEPALRWAREEDPTATYVINDYGLEINAPHGVTATQQRDRFRRLVEALRARGCAPDAIGTQAHDNTWVPPDLFKRVLDDLASAGVPVHVAEFWAHDDACPNRDQLTPQALRDARIQYVTDCYTIAFGHPSVTHFTYWGGTEFYEDGDPLVKTYRAAWQPSKLYDAVFDLVKRQWWTPAKTLTADANGSVAFRATHGRHRVTATLPGGRTWPADVDVRPGATEHEIRVV